MDRGAWWAPGHGVAKELDVTERLNNNKVTSEPPGWCTELETQESRANLLECLRLSVTVWEERA